jgi:hypothetical protein
MDPFRAMTEEDVGLPLEAWNYLMAMARRDQQGSLDQSAGGRPTAAAVPELVAVKNLSGEDRARGEVLGIDGPLFAAADAPQFFKTQIVLKGIRPAAVYLTDHVDGRFVILIEPIPAGRIGWAAIGGIAAVQIDLTATWHLRADIIHNDPAKLRSYPGGAAQIVAIDRTATGQKWAYVRWPVHPEVILHGKLKAQLNSGNHADMDIWQVNSGTWEDSGNDATVHAPLTLGSGKSIASGKAIAARWNTQAGRLEVPGAAEC